MFSVYPEELAAATAAVGAVTGMTGTAPLIVEQNFVQGQYELNLLLGDLGPGNFGALALGGKDPLPQSARRLQRDDKCGDLLDTEPGNISGPTKRRTARINAAATAVPTKFSVWLPASSTSCC